MDFLRALIAFLRRRLRTEPSILSPPAEKQPPFPPDTAAEYPPPKREIRVSTANELEKALGDARPGDHIVLASGRYASRNGFHALRPGAPEHPIVLRAEKTGHATLDDALHVRGTDWILWGIHFVDVLTTTGAHRLVVRRCTSDYRGTAGRWCTVVAADVHFDRCEFWGMSTRCIQSDPSVGGVRLKISRCYFHDWGFREPHADTIIGFGISDNDTDVDSGGLVEYCLFRNTSETDGRENLLMKSSGNVVRYCQFENTRFVQIRHGNRNRIEGCRFRGERSGVQVFDTDNVVVGCAFEDGASLATMTGDIDGDAWKAGAKGHPSSRRTRITLCSGPVVVGRKNKTTDQFPSVATRIEAHHSRNPIRLGFEKDTVIVDAPGETGVLPVRLGTADVGPFS